MNNTVQLREEREKALYAGGASVYVFIIIVQFFWAISGPLTKMSYAGFGVSGEDVFEVIHFAGLRLCGAGIIGLAYHVLRGQRLLPESLADFWQLTKLGLIMGVAQYLFFNFGAAFSSSRILAMRPSTPFTKRGDSSSPPKSFASSTASLIVTEVGTSSTYIIS